MITGDKPMDPILDQNQITIEIDQPESMETVINGHWIRITPLVEDFYLPEPEMIPDDQQETPKRRIRTKITIMIPVPEDPYKQCKKQLYKVSPGDMDWKNNFKIKMATARKLCQKEFLVSDLFDHVRKGNPTVSDLRSIWAGCYFETQTILWINIQRFSKATGMSHSALFTFTRKIHIKRFTEEEGETDYDKNLKDMLAGYGIPNRTGWCRYKWNPLLVDRHIGKVIYKKFYA